MEPTAAQAELLEQAATYVNAATEALREAKAQRDQALRQAADEGLSYRTISRLSGVSYQRIAQILGTPDDRLTVDQTMEAWCPKCDAAPGDRCKGTGGFHEARHLRRSAIQDGEVDDVVEGEPTWTPAL